MFPAVVKIDQKRSREKWRATCDNRAARQAARAIPAGGQTGEALAFRKASFKAELAGDEIDNRQNSDGWQRRKTAGVHRTSLSGSAYRYAAART